MTSIAQSKKLTTYEVYTEEGPIRLTGTDVFDGHHTMNELYDHRFSLFIALLKAYDGVITPLDGRGSKMFCWKSKHHDDGTMFEGWFIAGITKRIPSFVLGGDETKIQVSYHLPLKFWHKVSVMELDKAPKWDGHTSHDVIERLLSL